MKRKPCDCVRTFGKRILFTRSYALGINKTMAYTCQSMINKFEARRGSMRFHFLRQLLVRLRSWSFRRGVAWLSLLIALLWLYRLKSKRVLQSATGFPSIKEIAAGAGQERKEEEKEEDGEEDEEDDDDDDVAVNHSSFAQFGLQQAKGKAGNVYHGAANVYIEGEVLETRCTRAETSTKMSLTRQGERAQPSWLSLLFGGAGLARGWGDHIAWVGLREGLETAKSQRKPLCVLFHTSWCSACKDLAPLVAKSQELATLSQHFVMVNLYDGEHPVEKQWSPDGVYLPRILFVKHTGEVQTDLWNRLGNGEYKYYYEHPDEIIVTMKEAKARLTPC
eukprot:g69762.t1